MNRVWQVLSGGSVPPPLTQQEQAVLDALNQTKLDPLLVADLGTTNALNLGDALKAALVAEQTLEGVAVSYDRDKPESVQAWPSFLFPLADSLRAATVPSLTIDTDPK